MLILIINIIMTTLILFDVDGTLTESRLKIKQNMINTIDKLKQLENLDIGIVGGSNLSKQEEQLGIEILDKFKWKFSENGLVAYHKNELINKTSIADYLGEDKIKRVINTNSPIIIFKFQFNFLFKIIKK